MNALNRQRLDHRLAALWDCRVCFLTAPAGCGKTTLMAQFAVSSGVPVAWYRAEASDVSEAHLVAHLERSLAAALGIAGGWENVDQAVTALEHWAGGPALVVLDDVHVVSGTRAEVALGRLLDMLPPSIRVLVGARRMPELNLTRLRLTGELLELGADDLRFRSWEIERLFSDHYGEPILPEDLSALARHTEGWAAGLQLFHLATTGKPPAYRRRVLAGLATRSKLVREYLARNVLDELPDEIRRFLVDTSVLGVLTGPLCDDFLGTTGSAGILEHLERHQIFTFTSDDGVSYRYHEVLRSHLEGDLVAMVGESEVRRRSARAAALLEAVGATSEALRGYCRAEEWDAVGRLLGHRGEEIASDAGMWLEALPLFLVEGDPWLQLATARRHRANGRLPAALEAFRRAEAALGGVAGEACEGERLALALWTEPMPAAADGWVAMLRRATQRNPSQAAREAIGVPGSGGALAAGLATLLGGHIPEAIRILESPALHAETDPVATAAAKVAGAAATVLVGGSLTRPGVENLVAIAEGLGIPWLARLARVLLAATGETHATSEAAAVVELCRNEGDRWGASLVEFLAGVSQIRAGRPDHRGLDRAAEEFRSLGAGVLEAWCRAFSAMAQAWLGLPGARVSAVAAESAARSAAVRGAQAVAFAALAHADPFQRQDHRAIAEAISAECGLSLPTPPVELNLSKLRERKSSLQVRCLGRFSVARGSEVVDLTQVKPRARAVLYLLAANAGRPVHWEVLAEGLWPGSDPRAGARNLQVAVSSLRHVLEPEAGPRESTVLVREGDAYRVVAEALDVREFEDCVDAARVAHLAADSMSESEALQRALDTYGGDLLPEAGPAEWVVKDRERLRRLVTDAAETLAELLVARDEPGRAASVAERGLAIDAYRDRLWRLLLQALAAADDQAALARARRAYRAVLAEAAGPDLP